MVTAARFIRGMVIFSILMAGVLTALPAAMAAEGDSQEKPWERFSLNLGGVRHLPEQRCEHRCAECRYFGRC